MTITISWLRRRKGTVELLMASDSRLRSRGAMDQAQKLFRLTRGDCALAFCGDAQVAYPFFIQVATTLDNHIKTRTRALDVTHLSAMIGSLLNQLIDAWRLPLNDKTEELKTTRIMFGGWSSENQRFDTGFFQFENGKFRSHHKKFKLRYPWYESKRSLVFLGDYEHMYLASLRMVLERRHGRPPEGSNTHITFDFDYEPVEALYELLKRNDPEHTAIGGTPQLIKVYRFGNTLPFAVRGSDGYYLLGRRLFEWEKTEYPMLDLTQAQTRVFYPMEHIPLPDEVSTLEYKRKTKESQRLERGT